MSRLVNDYRCCILLNLGYGPHGRGPFIIRQEGYPPGSMTFEIDRYYLRRDGTWMVNLAVFVLPEEEKHDFIHGTIEEAIALLEGLIGVPVVHSSLPEDISTEELTLAARATFTGLWGRIHEAEVHPHLD